MVMVSDMSLMYVTSNPASILGREHEKKKITKSKKNGRYATYPLSVKEK